MYLSRIQINPARRGGRKLLGSPQAMHAAVLASFPQDDAERGRVLWRVDQDAHRSRLYVVSRPAPDFAHIVEQAGWQTTQDTWAVRPYGTLLDRLRPGQTWRFRLTANPSRTHEGKRLGHVTVSQQQEWFLSRTKGWGFTVPEHDGVPDVVVHDRRTDRFRRGAGTVTIAKASFDGVLNITDVDALRAALVAGLGPAKGYGCGLLTLAPQGRP
ncbi:type I-E CRISPR-associated protein Cas6/Cse3/CasE [Xylanimonas protaetiae]|uniref:Type I-E CRISPR-associated protein Cas6/Cse3/CasE n=1 Tax=Xylanimonas protaetiae TaxID=2509457 RepID=A0A4P6F604_9MICO|nr:type I-E CRISPR-associated protein Cas6/Cse3/CasE [Xylanimonas protaetiae]QAY71390.1 type I-E CRISPR-associated protein Cas6/Cse3/CasE [Xylanimonas protaetiae]